MDLISKMKKNLDYESLLILRQEMQAERKKIYDNKSNKDLLFNRASDLNFYIDRVENRIIFLEKVGHYINCKPSEKTK